MARAIIFSAPLIFLLFAIMGFSAWGLLILPAVAVLLPTPKAGLRELVN